MGEITREYRKRVADRIKAERDRTGLTQKEFAKKVGIANQTYNNLENGIGSLKIEHLQKISENCGCDMGYLLGDYDNRTHEATDICKVTGLSEEAVEILIKANNKEIFYHWVEALEQILPNKMLTDMQSEQDDEFIRLINSIILNYHQTLRTPDTEMQAILDGDGFPVNQIVDYGLSIQKFKELMESDIYDYILQAFDYDVNAWIKTLESEGMLDIDREYVIRHKMPSAKGVENALEKVGFKVSNDNYEETIKAIHQFFDYLSFMREGKKYQRFDIQEAFSRFMNSNFFEGEENGK